MNTARAAAPLCPILVLRRAARRLACILSLACCTVRCGDANLDASPDANAPTSPKVASLVQQDSPAAAPYAFCLVTHTTANVYHYAALAERSQRAYAARHGYGQQSFFGHISGAQFTDPPKGNVNDLWGGGLYWQKLTAVRQVLQDGILDGNVRRPCQWAVWLDADVLITNEDVALEDIVARYAPPPRTLGIANVDVLLAPDDRHPVSGGVFLLRNTAVGLAFLDAVSALYPAYKDNLLPEQTAMATVAYMVEPWPSLTRVDAPQPTLHPSVVVTPHRAFNSFPDLGRNQPEDVQWRAGDFVAHFAGVRHDEREPAMRKVLAEASAFGAACLPADVDL